LKERPVLAVNMVTIKMYPWMKVIYEICMWLLGGTTGVVHQQQQGSMSTTFTTGRWSAPILSS
jgi:hypothetical protein